MGEIPAFINSSASNAHAAIDVLEQDERFDVHDVPAEQLEKAIAELLRKKPDKVVVAGGDGTLATAATALTGTQTALGVIPAGTLNHFAGAVGIPEDPAEAVDVAVAGRQAHVSVGRVNQRLFLNTSAVGAYVDFVRMRERYETQVGYLAASFIAAAYTFCTLHGVAVKLEVAGEAYDFKSPLVFVGVGERELQPPRLGARKPNGRHLLHVLAVHPTSRARLLRMAVRTLKGGIRPWAGEDELESFFVEACEISLSTKVSRLSVDGEIIQLENPLRYEYERDALTVLVPRDVKDTPAE